MPVTLTYEIKQAIRKEFQQMKSIADFRQLLNRMVELQVEEVAERRKGKIVERYPVVGKNTKEILEGFNAYKENITEAELTFFSTSFKEDSKKRKRYIKFYIPKKSGGQREIKAPVEKLKDIQSALNLLLQVIYTTQEHAYGFVTGKSIKDNAAIHAGAAFVFNIDVKDFFPSIQFGRIKNVLQLSPFNLIEEREKIAFTIANLCTEDGVLPQGAPTSPILTNIICKRLDKRLYKFATTYNAKYSRYADDITFSSNEFIFNKRFKSQLTQILANEKFTLNTDKTRMQGKAYRQEVTGLTVNEKVNVNRQYLRSYRTLLHLYKKKSPEAALEYHYKRMPEALRKLKQEKQPTDIAFYMKNVIKGKYQFIKMILGDDKILPPFESKPKTGVVFIKIKEIYTIPEEVMAKLRAREPKTVVVAPVENKEEIVIQDDITSVVLEKWKQDGFESAIEIFKKHLNEK